MNSFLMKPKIVSDCVNVSKSTEGRISRNIPDLNTEYRSFGGVRGQAVYSPGQNWSFSKITRPIHTKLIIGLDMGDPSKSTDSIVLKNVAVSIELG